MKAESFIFGIRPVLEAIKSGQEPDRVLLRENLRGEGFRELFSLIREREIPFQFVPAEKLNHLSQQNHQGVIAWMSKLDYQKLEAIIPLLYEQGKTPLILYLDGITDVRNMGAIARTAECAGVDALVIPVRGSALINAETIKTSAGALYKIPVCRITNPKTAITYLKDSGLQIVAATEKGSREFTSVSLTQPLVLILGSEGKGISQEILNLTDERIRIPLLGEIASLNVSVAAGILLFEILRQRNTAG